MNIFLYKNQYSKKLGIFGSKPGHSQNTALNNSYKLPKTKGTEKSAGIFFSSVEIRA